MNNNEDLSFQAIEFENELMKVAKITDRGQILHRVYMDEYNVMLATAFNEMTLTILSKSYADGKKNYYYTTLNIHENADRFLAALNRYISVLTLIDDKSVVNFEDYLYVESIVSMLMDCLVDAAYCENTDGQYNDIDIVDLHMGNPSDTRDETFKHYIVLKEQDNVYRMLLNSELTAIEDGVKRRDYVTESVREKAFKQADEE